VKAMTSRIMRPNAVLVFLLLRNFVAPFDSLLKSGEPVRTVGDAIRFDFSRRQHFRKVANRNAGQRLDQIDGL
jgi:hypothetical protein